MSVVSSEAVRRRSPVNYYTGKIMSVTELQSKFEAGVDIVSNLFFCPQDPEFVTFRLKIGFGSRIKDYVAIMMAPTNRSITLCRTKYTVYDGKGAVLMSSPCFVGHRNLRACTYAMLCYLPREMGVGTWRVLCEVEYENPTSAIEVLSPSDSCGLSPSDSCGLSPSDSCVSALQEDLLKLLNSSNNADVTFLVEGEKIEAHKNILVARCSYFDSMFHSGMKESGSKEIRIEDAEPAVFAGLLHFLYSGSPPKNLGEIALSLLALADKYGLEDLKKMCEARVCSNLNAENLVDVLVLAESHNFRDLQSRAAMIFPAHIGALKKSEQKWGQLRANPDVPLKLLEHFCIE